MQIATADRAADPAPAYVERLSPSLWAIVSAAVVAPMAALVFVPLDASLSLVIGVVVAVLVVTLLLAASPVLKVSDGMLFAGRARIPVDLLGDASWVDGEDARLARGPGLDARAWHLLRGGIDPVIRIPVTDPDDPTPEWVLSSRTPDRLAAAIRRARTTPSTPRR